MSRLCPCVHVSYLYSPGTEEAGTLPHKTANYCLVVQRGLIQYVLFCSQDTLVPKARKTKPQSLLRVLLVKLVYHFLKLISVYGKMASR